jgi:hypothetical protein
MSLNVLSIGATVRPLVTQEAAERDDEGRNAEIGDHQALESTEYDAEDQAARQRENPGRRMFEAEQLREQVGLDDAHDHADEAEHRSDRQIDVARHDD